MSQSSTNLYEFGPFRLDAAERVLWRGKELIVLPPKVFDTLWTLVREGGRVVSKKKLMDEVWADAVVEESNLSQNIYTLRRALGVDEEGRQFIETIPRRGYRFAAPVRISVEDKNGGVYASDSPASPAIPPATVGNEVRSRSALRFALFGGLGVLVLFSLGFGLYQFISRRGEKGRIAPIEQVHLQRLTDSSDVVYPTISPDGELLAYVRLAEKEGSVWIKQIATMGSGSQVLPASRKSYRSLAFSPDGRSLFFREEADPGAIYRTLPFGGEPKKVADDVWSDFSLSPDGRQLAFVRRDPARNAQSLILSEIGGAERVLGARRSPQEYGESAPGWSPDGLKLVVTAGEEQHNLLIVDALSGEERELRTPRWRAVWKALWTPDGKYLIFSARANNEPISQLWMLAYPEGEVRRLTNDLESYFWLSLSADGRKLITRQQKIFSHLWLLPEGDLKKARQLTFGVRNFDGYHGLAWTSEGRIIFSSFVNNNTDLYSMNPDGSNRVPLTANAGPDNVYPVVSPDGRYIVFTSNRTGASQIWRMDNDGRNQKQLTQQKGSAQYPAFSPEGSEVFFIRRGAGVAEICRIPIEGGTPITVSRLSGAAAEGFLSISTDGKWMAYHQVSTGGNTLAERTERIAVLSVDGTAEPRLFDLPMRRPLTHWSADGIDYAAGTFNTSSLLRQPIAYGKPQKLCDFPDRVFNFAWSLDRKNLVVSRGKLEGDALLITNLP